MAKTLHSSNSSCAHYRRCFSNIVHNNSGQKNCAECEDIDKWLVKSGVYVLRAFALQWTHKTFWSSIFDYSLVILRVEYLKKKKMKSKWVNGANAGWKSHAFVQSNSKLIFGVCIGQWH